MLQTQTNIIRSLLLPDVLSLLSHDSQLYVAPLSVLINIHLFPYSFYPSSLNSFQFLSLFLQVLISPDASIPPPVDTTARVLFKTFSSLFLAVITLRIFCTHLYYNLESLTGTLT
jgi:hypothetical protein